MNIVIIGSGNVAAVLGRKFRAAGHHIVQVLSRNAKTASELAYEWNTVSTNYISAISHHADVYLLAVSDQSVAEIANKLRLPGKVVAHTAAAVSKDVLKHVSAHTGVFYPLQSLRKELNTLPDIPLFVDASDDLARQTLTQLAESISSAPGEVTLGDDDARLKLHVAAVIVSNFTNHLYALAEQYCRTEGLDFKQLIPLIEQTALRVETASPSQLQTGPAARHDLATIERHLALLEPHPVLKKIYELMTTSIHSAG